MYEILKIGAPVKVLLVNNENMTGNIFITEALLSARGIPLTEDFLNEADDRFLPFESAARAYRLLNKHQVVDIRTGHPVGRSVSKHRSSHATSLPILQKKDNLQSGLSNNG